MHLIIYTYSRILWVYRADILELGTYLYAVLENLPDIACAYLRHLRLYLPILYYHPSANTHRVSQKAFFKYAPYYLNFIFVHPERVSSTSFRLYGAYRVPM